MPTKMLRRLRNEMVRFEKSKRESIRDGPPAYKIFSNRRMKGRNKKSRNKTRFREVEMEETIVRRKRMASRMCGMMLSIGYIVLLSA